jgi:hypothetical protein
VPHLESYPHHCGALDIVGLGEGRPPTAGTDVPDNGLDPLVTMVPVRGGRTALPVKVMIFVDPAAGASAPVWAAAAVRGMAAACALPWSAAGASMHVRATVTVPLGVRGCPLRCLLSRCLPHPLELIVGATVG